MSLSRSLVAQKLFCCEVTEEGNNRQELRIDCKILPEELLKKMKKKKKKTKKPQTKTQNTPKFYNKIQKFPGIVFSCFAPSLSFYLQL